MKKKNQYLLKRNGVGWIGYASQNVLWYIQLAMFQRKYEKWKHLFGKYRKRFFFQPNHFLVHVFPCMYDVFVFMCVCKYMCVTNTFTSRIPSLKDCNLLEGFNVLGSNPVNVDFAFHPSGLDKISVIEWSPSCVLRSINHLHSFPKFEALIFTLENIC